MSGYPIPLQPIRPGVCWRCQKSGANIERMDDHSRKLWFHRDCWPKFCRMMKRVNKSARTTWSDERLHGR